MSDNSLSALGTPLTVLALFMSVVPSEPAQSAERMTEPLRFFDGRTEMVSLVKVVMQKPYRSRTLSVGHISSDGTLSFVQQIIEDGKPAQQRQWRMRRVSPGTYSGTMSQAVGPVTVQERAGRFLFKFRMKGNLAVEQWITPLSGGNAARSKVTVREFGMRVASSEGLIRKL